jgi:NitT/TauT family transport system substrate-binding protein
MKEYGFEAQLVKTGTVPATFTQVMSGQVDIGFSTPPFGLEAAAYRETIDWMYSEDAAIDAFARWANVTPIMARRVRDGFYPKEMLQLDEVSSLDDIIRDAIAFKYIARPLPAEQIGLLLRLPRAHGR